MNDGTPPAPRQDGGGRAVRSRRYVTQADIAREAGVSRPLVSIALKGRGRIAEDTRARILATAERLGYIGSGIATSLAGNQSGYLIGFLASDLANPVFVEIYKAVAGSLEPLGHRVLVVEGGIQPETEDSHLKELVSLRPDGVMLAGYVGSTTALRAAAKTLPVVAVTRRIDSSGIDSVLADDFAGGRMAAELLISLGHTDIAHLRLPSSIPYDARVDGYVAAMQEAGLTPRLLEPAFSVSGARETVSALLAHEGAPTALFCGNDVLALGAVDAVHDADLEVGRDLAIIGYDNTDIAARVGLASIDQHATRLGRLAAETLLTRMTENQDTPDIVEILTPKLIDRPSSGPPRSRSRFDRGTS